MSKLNLDLSELEVTTFLTTTDGGAASEQMHENRSMWTNPMDNCISASDVKMCLCQSGF